METKKAFLLCYDNDSTAFIIKRTRKCANP